MLMEVKSVTLVKGGVGLFPDAVTARGARHLEELIAARAEGKEAAVFFLLQRPDAGRIRAARAIDPRFAETLARAREAGVRLLGRRCHVSPEGIALGDRVPVEADA
jgi:sugar fermentation stimulation protein A